MIYRSTDLAIYLSMDLHPPGDLPIYRSTDLTIYTSIDLASDPQILRPTDPTIYISTDLAIYRYIDLSVQMRMNARQQRWLQDLQQAVSLGFLLVLETLTPSTGFRQNMLSSPIT